MYTTHIFVTALAASNTAQAFNFAEEAHSANPAASCPAVWGEISTALTAQFLADGQCTDAARAAIRGAFHDCFPGSCDGSLILASECSAIQNRGLERLCENLGNIASQKEVGVADLIQFAAAHAIKTCPGGPTVPVKIGRRDSHEANDVTALPQHNSSAGDLIREFGAKGFTPTDLAALIGAHSAAKQRNVDPSKAGAGLDSTPGTWDNKFYSETKTGRAPFTLQADKNVAQHPLTAIPFATYVLSKGAWDSAFVRAMTKMSMMGVDTNSLIDCTSALPGGSRKREIKRSNLFDRLKW
ncbi:heme peroxidase [Phaeosphaeriaceae sp. PMI808]|nr:heme peroxidase [Phaeosphaeriaceae sp. PMI808]